MVHHGLLSERLKGKFGIADTSLRWAESYLSEGTYFVIVGLSSSQTVPTTSRVPQGSVPYPMLLTGYAPPIGRLIDSSTRYHKYVDDTQLYTSLSTDRAALDRLYNLSNGLQLWFWTNHLLLNPGKSIKYAIFAAGWILCHPAEKFTC